MEIAICACQSFRPWAGGLSYLVGLYCLVSVTLNTFDVPVPES